MNRPTVSLIVPTFNRTKYLPSAIESLIAQTHKFDELLIVDDGSTDDTAQVVAKLPGNPRYFRKENGGRASAINFGVRHAKGDLIWIFDDDDIALPHALATLIAPFLASETDFTYSPWFLCNELRDGTLEIEGTSELQAVGGKQFFYEMLFRCFTQGNAMLIARRCYDAIGPMREDLIRSQDHDFMLRLGRVFNAVPVSEPTFHWRRHLGARGAGAGKMFGVEKIIRNWHLYRQKIFVDLHRDLPLQEYLPPDRRAIFPENLREAQLTRVVVMSCHGLWHLAIPELVEIAGMMKDVPITQHENSVLLRLGSATTSDSLVDLATKQTEARQIASIRKTDLGKAYIDHLVHAAYWQCRRHWQDNERPNAYEVLRSILVALGVAPVARVVFDHLSHRRVAA